MSSSSSSSSSYSSSIPQPLVAYPHSISTHPPSNPKGSFGPVFIVLAIIAVLATIACIVGRLCARRLCQPKQPAEMARARDMEHGFEAAAVKGKKGEARHNNLKGGGGGANRVHQEMRGNKEDAKFGGEENYGAKLPSR